MRPHGPVTAATYRRSDDTEDGGAYSLTKIYLY